MEKNLGHSINKLCEFRDSSLEKEYFTSDISKAMRYIKPAVLLLGILNTLFFIPDYFLIRKSEGLVFSFTVRIIFLILVTLFYFFIDRIKDSRIISYIVTAYEITGLLIFILIFYQYESPNFLIQAFGVIIIILAVFLVPNRWLHMIFVSVFLASSFLLISALYLPNINISEFSAGAIYIFIVIILTSISSYRISYFKRTQYIDHKELLKLSVTDPLTGIYNRGKLYEAFDFWTDFSSRYSTKLSFAIFDFDNFKVINDTYGHLTGDMVIVDTINLIKNVMRKTDVFARWGGDEFVIFLPHTNKADAVAIIERIRLLICSHKYDKVGKVSCSFGIVLVENAGEDLDTIFNRADELLYLAKKSGKNTLKY